MGSSKIITKFSFITLILSYNLLTPSHLFPDQENTNGETTQGKQNSLVFLKHNFRLNHTPVYYKNMGKHYKEIKDYQNAIKNYEYALLLNKECGECYYSLGEIYYFQKLYVESNSNLKIAVNKKFEFYFDKIKAIYLLAITYFYKNQDELAVDTLQKLIISSKPYFTEQEENSPLANPNYYAPAYFILSLYYRNNGILDLNSNINFLERALQLGYKKEYVDYFFYEYYNKHKQYSIAFEYLTQAKIIDKDIETHIKTLIWLKSYDIFMDISKQ